MRTGACGFARAGGIVIHVARFALTSPVRA